MNAFPTLLELLRLQFAGTSMSEGEKELARLCWMGGAGALLMQLAKSRLVKNTLEIQNQYVAELDKFAAEFNPGTSNG